MLFNHPLNPATAARFIKRASANFTNHIKAMENFKVDPVKGNISLAIDLRSLTTSSQDGLKLLEKVCWFDICHRSFSSRFQLQGMLGSGPAATAVKSFLNGSLCLNVASDGSMTVTATTRDNFPQFSKLPTEIRLQIWKEAMPGPRVVEVYLIEDQSQYDGKTYYVADPASRTPAPTILHINHESRREGLKIYSRIFSRSRLPPGQGRKPIYFDPANDIPYLSHFVTGSLDRWNSVFSMARDAICPWQLAKEQYSQLTWITIPVPKTSSECKDAADSCRYLAALEGITMIINEDDQTYMPQKTMGPTEHQNQLTLCQEESSENVWWIEAKAKITDRMEDFILKNDIYTLKRLPRIKAGKISRINNAC
jgi:hypothetical protein